MKNKGGKYDFSAGEDEPEEFKYTEIELENFEATSPSSHIKFRRTSSTSTKQKDDDNVSIVDREQWDKPIEFLMSCIAMSVGLGNVWRFPFVAYNNGGGAFLIPYVIVLFFIGKPLYFLEMSMGQFTSKGQIKIWRMAPFFKGVGYGSMFGMAFLLSFYCALMAITIFYFVQSFSSELPWAVCNPEWEVHGISCENGTVSGSNKSIPELYFKLSVMKEKIQIDDGIGNPDWRLTICLFTAWIIIFLTLVNGVQSAGKIAYVTALFPYVILLIFLIRGVTLPGAFKGIWYFIEPKWGKLLDGGVWVAAVTQCFFSLSVGFGPIIMYSSYNSFKHNVYQDAMIVSILDTFTSLLAGITIFSILGNLATQLDVDISKVVGGGSGLAFVSYPDAISKFTFLPQLFAVLFFLMLLVLGIGSGASLANGLITITHDEFPNLNKRYITIGVCILGFLAGLVYVTPGGLWLIDLVDYFGAGFIIYVMAILEVVGMIWVYGLSNVVRDIEFMLGDRKISMYWKTCWTLIPIVLFVVLIYSLFTDPTKTYEGRPYPQSAMACGWVLVSIALSMIPLCALHSVLTGKGDGFMEKLKRSFKPDSKWGPARVRKSSKGHVGPKMSFRSQWKADTDADKS